MIMRITFFLITILLLGVGCRVQKQGALPPLNLPLQEGEKKELSPPARGGDKGVVREEGWERVDFAQFNPIFRFSAEIPQIWQVEYVPEIEALNVYGSAQAAMPARELSRIFVRYFEANDFLTLRTVDILNRKETKVNGHDAVEYEIAKKPGVADFPHQPGWRNERHQVTDVRFTKNTPSVFYVFARNPALPTVEFEKFLASLMFHNDRASFQTPLDRAHERITKKPFGLQVAPDNSPVQPERFSGYHTGVDFEVFAEENDQDVQVRAFCGGPIREKRPAEGYGGVVVQECLLEDQPVTVVYGHLNVDPSPPPSPVRRGGLSTSPIPEGEGGVRDYLAPGDTIGVLGAAFSAQTDGERQHLHFGIHKGTKIDIRGYVERASDLDQWLDPWQYMTTR